MSKENAFSKSKNYALIKLDTYASFESVHEMDQTVKEYNKELTKPLYETLNLLKQFSCKVFGVSHLKIATMANKLDKSIATIKRHIKYLKEHGFITVVNTLREKKGGKGANAYIINTSNQRSKLLNELSQMSYRKPHKNNGKTQSQRAFDFIAARKETIFSLNLLKTFISTKNCKVSKKLKRLKNIKNYSQCPEGVPEHVYLSYKAFFSDKQIEKFYDIALNKLVPFNFPREYDEQIIDKAFRTLLLKQKNYLNGKGEEVKKIFSYFAGIICRQADKYKEFIQYSHLQDKEAKTESSLKELGPVPAWLKNRSDRQNNLENEEDFELKKKILEKEVEAFCYA